MDIVEEEERLKFLVSGSYDALPSSYLKLRSYLNSYSSNLANIHGLKLPKWFTKTDLTCRQCFLPWSGDSYSIKLLPVKKKNKKNSSKTRVSSKKTHSKSKLPRNHLVLKCKICNSQSHFYLLKIVRNIKAVPKEKNKVEVGKKKKKKKRKKDKMYGLNIPLQTSLKKNEFSKGSLNKTNNSASKLNRAADPTKNNNRNVQQVNLKVRNSQSVPQLPAIKIQQPIKNKNLCSRPNTAKLQSKTSKNKNKNLQKLKEMVQEQKETVKKTLKDFLTLI